MDEKFRKTLPEDLDDDVRKFMQNPSCGCNHPIYLKLMRKARQQLQIYYPTKSTPTEEESEKRFDTLAKNDWQVINCGVHELKEYLRELGPGRKQLDIARYEDQVTVVVNHLEGIY